MATIANVVKWSNNYGDFVAQQERIVAANTASVRQVEQTIGALGTSATGLGQKFSAAFSGIGDKIAHELQSPTAAFEGLKEAVESPVSSIKGLGTAAIEVAGPIGVAAGALLAVAGAEGAVIEEMFSLAEAAAKTGGEIQDFALKSQISVESASALRFAAQALGKDVDSLGNAMFMMSKRVDEGSVEVQKGLGKLGISWKQFADLKPDEQLLLMSDRLRALGPEVNKASVVFEVLGKAGKEALPTLLKPLRELTEQGKALGVTWSEEDVEAAHEFEIAINTLHIELARFGTTIGKELIPTLTTLVKELTSSKLVMEGIPAVAKLVYNALNEMFHLEELPLAIQLLEALAVKLGLIEAPADAAAAALARLHDQGLKPIPAHAAAADRATAALGESNKVAALMADLHAQSQTRLSPAITGYITAALTAGKSTSEITKALAEAHLAGEEAAPTIDRLKTAHDQAATAAKQHAKALADMRDAAIPLTDEQKALVLSNNALGLSHADTAALIHRSVAAVDEYSEHVANARAVDEMWAKTRAEMAKGVDSVYRHWMDAEQKEADASAAGLAKQLVDQEKYQSRVNEIGLTGVQLALKHIDDARTAEIRSMGQRTEANAKFYDENRRLIDEYYAHEQHLALGTANTIVERMNQQGVLTKAQLADVAAAATRDYGQMKTAGLYTYAQLEDAAERAAEAAVKASGRSKTAYLADLARIGQAVSQVGQALGDAIGGYIVRGLGAGISALGQMSQATENFRTLQAKAAIEGKSLWKDYFSQAATYAVQWGLTVLSIYQQTVAIVEKLRGDLTAGVANPAFAQRGGRDQIRTDAITAGVDTSTLFETRSVDEFNFRLRQFDQAVADSNRRLQAYGLTWRDLGSWIQKANVDQAARTLITDFRDLSNQGVDTTRILKGMSGSLSQLVVDAVTTGQRIPGALEPMLRTLIQSGQLSEAAARALLGLADDGVPAFKDVEDAAKRYGLEMDKLGPKVNQLRINDVAAQIVKDWKLLQAAGADTNTVLVGMQKSVQDLVTDALRMGLKIPESMRPIIQAMIDAGLLTDQFGTKLTDVGGLEFEQPITAAIDKLLAKLDELIDHLSGVGNEAIRARGELEKVGQAIPRGSTPTVPNPAPGSAVPSGGYTPGAPKPDPGPAVPRGPDFPGDDGRRYATGGRVLAFATGGGVPEVPTYLSTGSARVIDFAARGTDTVPAMLTPGEVVLNAAQQKNVAGELQRPSGPSSVSVSVHVEAGSVKLETREERKRFAEDIGDAVARSVSFAQGFDDAARHNPTGLKTTIRRVA